MFDDNKKYLVLTRGVPGSGKSTLVSKLFGNKIESNIICPDNIREEFKEKKKEWKEHFEYNIWEIASSRLKESLETKRITVMDATFITRQSILRQYKTMNSVDPSIKLVIIDFSDIPLEKALCNNRYRKRYVPEEVIERMYNRMKRTNLLEFEAMVVSHNVFES